MAYADKCFYFDWGNRMIPTRDFDDFDKISVRWRWTSARGATDSAEETKGVSIELWGIEREDGVRAEDHEVVLTKENALLLAEKLRRAVAELDLEDYLADLENDVDILKHIHSRYGGDNSFEEEYEARMEAEMYPYKNKKGGLEGALANYANTPSGADMVKKIQGGHKC